MSNALGRKGGIAARALREANTAAFWSYANAYIAQHGCDTCGEREPQSIYQSRVLFDPRGFVLECEYCA